MQIITQEIVYFQPRSGVTFCLWCGKVVPKLFVCIVQLLVIPWLSAFSLAQVLCWHSCWFSDLQAPVAIVFLDKVFKSFFFFFAQFTWVYILLTFLFPCPKCSTSVSEGICLLTHLSGARGRCSTWLWWRLFITCRSVSTLAGGNCDSRLGIL